MHLPILLYWQGSPRGFAAVILDDETGMELVNQGKLLVPQIPPVLAPALTSRWELLPFFWMKRTFRSHLSTCLERRELVLILRVLQLLRVIVLAKQTQLSLAAFARMLLLHTSGRGL